MKTTIVKYLAFCTFVSVLLAITGVWIFAQSASFLGTSDNAGLMLGLIFIFVLPLILFGIAAKELYKSLQALSVPEAKCKKVAWGFALSSILIIVIELVLLVMSFYLLY